MGAAGLRGWLAAQCDISSRKSKMQNISHCYQQGDADVLCQWARAPETAQLCNSKEQKLCLPKITTPKKPLVKLCWSFLISNKQQFSLYPLPPLRKGPDEGTAPNSFCKISLWHTAACLDPVGVDLAGDGNAADPFRWAPQVSLLGASSSCSQVHFSDPAACNHVLAIPLGAFLKGQDNFVFFFPFFSLLMAFCTLKGAGNQPPSMPSACGSGNVHGMLYQRSLVYLLTSGYEGFYSLSNEPELLCLTSLDVWQ